MLRLSSWKGLMAATVTVLMTALPIQPLPAAEEYLSISDYLSLHPQQSAIMARFAETVRGPARPIGKTPERAVRIAIVYPGLQASDYWHRSQASFEQRLRQLQIPYELNAFFSHPSIDTVLQSQQLSEALQWQPDYLAFTLDVAPQSRMIERLLAQGAPKLILQNITTPLVRWQTHKPFLYVGFDHAQGTRLMAERMLSRIDYQGKYLMLYFTPGYVSQMRGDTFASEAAKHPQVIQVAAYYTDGNRDKAYAATRQTLREHPDLKLIFASSTDVALGALRALREADRQDILLNGWGGGDAELQALQAHGLDLTVMRINDDNGIAMAEAIRLDLLQQPEQVPHIFAGDIELLHDGMALADVERLKQQAFRLSNLPLEIR